MTVSKATRKTRRSYASPTRQRQAAQTRKAVIQAAAHRFAERGYTATTMKEIAEQAGVSVETVYGQGSKASLLIAAVDQIRAGDADSGDTSDRTDMRSVAQALDSEQALQHLQTLITTSLPAALPILTAFRKAADSDPDIAVAYEAYEAKRWADLQPITHALAPHLRAGLSVRQAADVIWSLLDPTAAEGLLARRAWTIEQWATWVTDALNRLLLTD